MGRLYPHPVGVDVPSCTTITGQLDKSGALTYWAAGAACDYIMDAISVIDEEACNGKDDKN